MTAPVRALVAVTLAIPLALAGCTSSHSPAKTTSSSSNHTPTNAELQSLLIKASDITVDKFSLTKTTPVSQSDAVGISGLYANASHNRVLSVILIHFPSRQFLQASLTETQTLAAQQLTHNPASTNAVNVGEGGQIFQGSNDTGPLSILVFGEGTYIVTMEFVSKNAGDNVPASVVTDLGLKQDAKLKAS